MNTTTRRLLNATLILSIVGAGALHLAHSESAAPATTPLRVVVMPTVMVVASREAMMREAGLAPAMPVVELPMVVVTGRRTSFDAFQVADARP